MKRTVLITGAAGGIGRQLVSEFLELGDEVIAVDCSQAGLESLQGCQRLRTITADLMSGSEWSNALSHCLLSGETVDVLVANAGGASAPTLTKTDEESWRHDINLNLNSVVRTVDAVKSGMIAKRRGAIVIMGSVNALMYLGHPAYSAAKAALIHYTKSLATEYGKFGVRANMILPGTVRTPAWRSRVEANPKVFEQLIQWYPLGRVVDPEDIAKAAIFLASDAARSITGVALPVDCGLTAGNRLMAQNLTLEEI
jgi:NAD(P)-dependent dehydrogenase (short-subunit alcohol dehydrogenase family)